MSRHLVLLYGLFCYVVFFATFLYSIWFVWTMDQALPSTSLGRAMLINTGLLLLFALQHSGMARQGFKRVWTRIVPQVVERSTYVLFSSVALFLVAYFWQPMPSPIWSVEAAAGRIVLQVLFWAGWALVLVSTVLIDHFDLFGLRQVWTHWRGRPYAPPAFATPGPYKLVRHPLYLGFVVAFWSAPQMTFGHLYFAGVTTAWILLAIYLEERDLMDYHGEKYAVYRSGVSMLVPWPSKKAKP